MDFDKRLDQAIKRGEQTRAEKGREQVEQALTEEELRQLHSKYRLELSDHIEKCLQALGERFPGFAFETVVSEEGWGGKVTRDDITLESTGRRRNLYSRLEMVIRPFSDAHIIELSAKGTIRNKEAFNRSHYQMLSDVDIDSFSELIDLWVLEYAEHYAAGE